jgi:hypothetical protein
LVFIDSDPRVRRAIATLNHYWYKRQYPAVPYPEDVWWRDERDPVVAQVIQECGDNPSERDHHDAPFQWLFQTYYRWAVEQGASHDHAGDFAAYVILGKPNVRSSNYTDGDADLSAEIELVSGYLQNPTWRPLSEKKLRGRLWPKTGPQKHEVHQPKELTPAQQARLDIAAERSTLQVGFEPSGSWYATTPERVITGAAALQAREEERLERAETNELRWRELNEDALSRARDRNNAGRRSDRAWIEAFGPWDAASLQPALRHAGYIPPRTEPLDMKPASRTDEGRALTRARERYLSALADSAGYTRRLGPSDYRTNATDLMKAIAAAPGNRYQAHTDQDLVDLIRQQLAVTWEAWNRSLTKPAPLFVQQFVGAACALNLTVPPTTCASGAAESNLTASKE